MTAQTPVYGIKYPVIGEPIRTTRQILEDNAKAVEAALIAGPASPPNAQDLATLSGRVTALDTDTGWVSLTPNTPVILGTKGCAVRRLGRTVELLVDASWNGTWSAPFLLFPALATQFRPPRSRNYAGLWYGGASVEIDVLTTGEVLVAGGGAHTGVTGAFMWTV